MVPPRRNKKSHMNAQIIMHPGRRSNSGLDFKKLMVNKIEIGI